MTDTHFKTRARRITAIRLTDVFLTGLAATVNGAAGDWFCQDDVTGEQFAMSDADLTRWFEPVDAVPTAAPQPAAPPQPLPRGPGGRVSCGRRPSEWGDVTILERRLLTVLRDHGRAATIRDLAALMNLEKKSVEALARRMTVNGLLAKTLSPGGPSTFSHVEGRRRRTYVAKPRTSPSLRGVAGRVLNARSVVFRGILRELWRNRNLPPVTTAAIRSALGRAGLNPESVSTALGRLSEDLKLIAFNTGVSAGAEPGWHLTAPGSAIVSKHLLEPGAVGSEEGSGATENRG